MEDTWITTSLDPSPSGKTVIYMFLELCLKI